MLFGDGSQRRDCVHVDDVVDALLLAATTPDATGETFNLGHTDSLPLRRDRGADAGGGRQSPAGCAASRGTTSCCASTSAASRATSPRPSGSSAGRRRSRSPRASRSTLRLLPRSLVVPVVDLTRRHRRFEAAFVEATRRVLGLRHGAASAPSWPPWSATWTAASTTAPAGDNAVVGVASGASGLQLTLAALGVSARRRGDRPGVHGRADGVGRLRRRRPPGAGRRRPGDRGARRRGRRGPRSPSARRRSSSSTSTAARRPSSRCSRSGSRSSRTPPRPTVRSHDVTGVAAVYSFYPTKNVGGIGDGGADRDPVPRPRRACPPAAHPRHDEPATCTSTSARTTA